MASSTALMTLYRLRGVAPTLEAMHDALDLNQLTTLGATLHVPETLGVPAVYFTCGMERSEAPWCDNMFRTTGIHVVESVRRTAAVLLLGIDGDVYAVACDQGYRLIPEHLKDKRFGLSFAIRQIDPNMIRGAVTKALGQARTDISLIPTGAPVPMLGLRDHMRIVRSLGGYLDDIPLTRSRYTRGKAFTAHGGCGLRVALGIEPHDLIADIREIARVCGEQTPHRELEFVDHIVPVNDGPTLALLDTALDDMLGRPADGRISVSVPADHHDAYASATAFRTRINSSGSFDSDDFDLGYVLQRARLAQTGRRLEALRQGTVTLLRDRYAGAAETLAVTSAVEWLETEVSLGSRRFWLMDGAWYEIGFAYLRETTATVAGLFRPTPYFDAPAWQRGDSENTYNNQIAKNRTGWVCLDTKNVRNPLRRTDDVEICDVITNDNTLILVKHAEKSAPLSHLFSQARVAVELLFESADVRAQLARRVHEESKAKGDERTLPADFTPKHVVLAIRLKDGQALTPESIFGFSQIAIAQAAKALAARGVTVEVIGIPSGAQNFAEAA
ncbi:TIGR04141 family sporadically distributed protein [Streptomyces sp. NPDC050698]